VPFRIVSALMGLLFVWFAAMQLNDPDPGLWIGTYGVVAALSFVAAADRGPWLLPGAAAVAMVALLAAIFEPGRPIDLDDELIREELGLVLAIGWMLVVAFVRRRAA